MVRKFPAIQILTLIAGCAPSVRVQNDPAYVPTSIPESYDDSAWESVLREHVHGGLVDYKRLFEDPVDLQKYIGLISVVGPESTPELFPTPEDKICYYINAYNACGLLIVQQYYPVKSVHHMPYVTGFEHKHTMRVDGRNTNLAGLRANLEQASQDLPRVLFCLSEASMGSPELASESYQPQKLNEQLQQAVDQALANPHLFRADHDNGKLFIWLRMMSQKQKFLDYYQRNFSQSSTRLLPLLIRWSPPDVRERFTAAQNYEEKIMPVNRQLNDYRRSSR